MIFTFAFAALSVRQDDDITNLAEHFHDRPQVRSLPRRWDLTHKELYVISVRRHSCAFKKKTEKLAPIRSTIDLILNTRYNQPFQNVRNIN